MNIVQFFFLGFGIYTLRLLLFPIYFLLFILLSPVHFILRDKDNEKTDKFLEFYENIFMWLFGPPFGFFSAALAFYISLVISLVYIL